MAFDIEKVKTLEKSIDMLDKNSMRIDKFSRIYSELIATSEKFSNSYQQFEHLTKELEILGKTLSENFTSITEKVIIRIDNISSELVSTINDIRLLDKSINENLQKSIDDINFSIKSQFQNINDVIKKDIVDSFDSKIDKEFSKISNEIILFTQKFNNMYIKFNRELEKNQNNIDRLNGSLNSLSDEVRICNRNIDTSISKKIDKLQSDIKVQCKDNNDRTEKNIMNHFEEKTNLYYKKINGKIINLSITSVIIFSIISFCMHLWLWGRT